MSDLFDIRKQLAFYGSYHSNPINIAIHILFVPLIMWSFQVLAYDLGKPTFLPQVHYHLNDYLKIEITYGTLQGLVWLAYYYVLDPIAAIAGHRFAEGRSPALLDNPVSALILAPFFVHLEILFKFGYKPAMYRQLQNDVGVEIAKLRKAEGDKKRAAEKRTH
ncbi:hypothetical protein BJV77DRAFT_1142607 [Russula vinacea]|nr:hypothetical protein BJV77DRAFT_1142607 [Russula vinacea]